MDSAQPSEHSISNSIESVYRTYSALAGVCPLDADAGLGGKLVYAGAISVENRALLFAANIAGAASLAASADPAAQRLAIRDGLVDFSVTSLEEALRILKNEVRKRLPVSVAVLIEPSRLVEQMLDRGVLPDLLGAGADADGSFAAQGAVAVCGNADIDGRFVSWSVDREFSRWMGSLDVYAQSVLPEDDLLRRRWLRLAPRYLGRLAQRRHGVALNSDEEARFRDKARAAIRKPGEQVVRIEIDGELL